MLVQAKYEDIRSKMKPGDILAFGGRGMFSSIIKIFTYSPVSHVGIVMATENNGVQVNHLIESTSLEDANGVSTSRLSDVIAHYNGEVWWLPLKKKMTKAQEKRFFKFLDATVGREYDMWQAVKSALSLITNREDSVKYFCSELASAALEHVGIVDELNASEVTPADLVRWNIYYEHYYQLKGEESEIKGWNTEVPA